MYCYIFLVELTNPHAESKPEDVSQWILSVDGASNLKGSGAGVILEGPDGILIEQSLRFSFKASNNQEEYEALIAGMLLAKEIGATKLLIKSDSTLVTRQVEGEFQARDPQLAKYLEFVQALAKNLLSFKFIHVPRDQNCRADLLSKLTTYTKPGQHKSVIRETLVSPRVEIGENYQIMAIQVNLKENWMSPIKRYIVDGQLPGDDEEASRVRKSSSMYVLIDGNLFQYGYSRPLLICVDKEEATRIRVELHEGICGSHIGGRALMLRVLRAGLYWPTMQTDYMEYVRRCEQCQKHADWARAPPKVLHSINALWPFHTWEINILRPFPHAIRQLKFLIVVVEYFTKWIEAEPVAIIIGNKIRDFIWKNIVCMFGVSRRLILDNGTQFVCSQVQQLCKEVGIKQVFSSVEHPQMNGQAEAANKVIL